MISFLRKIRKSLIESGSTQKPASPGRYLLYAIGEIALVVIGILIALQINNWNEWRQDRILEIEILKEIKANLKEDMNDHNQNMDNVHGIIRSCNIILNHLDNNLPYHDSLGVHFGWLPMGANYDELKSGYELMLSEGKKIIQNDSLRNKISSLYGNKYSWLRSWLKDRQYLQGHNMTDQMIANFRTVRTLGVSIPSNYEALKSNDSFRAAITSQEQAYQLTKKFYIPIIRNVEDLILEIDKEIIILSN